MLNNNLYTDKQLEQARYDERAIKLVADFNHTKDNRSKFFGAQSFPLYLRSPYTHYEDLLSNLKPGSFALEIGSGTGVHTGALLLSAANVIATDISEQSLHFLSQFYSDYATLKTQVADMENLPFDNEYFDVVTSAGSLSYGDNKRVLTEIYRVLKKGGVFICVDSLNCNWFYRMNRWVHYLRGERTLSTLKQMPTIETISLYSNKFCHVDVRYFGSILWAAPILKRILGETYTAKITDFFDQIIHVERSAFKFVMVAKKEIK